MSAGDGAAADESAAGGTVSARSFINPLAGRRVLAYGLDALGYLGIAAAMVPLGVWLYLNAPPTVPQTMAISAIPPVLAAAWAAWAESRPAGATWGKRRLGLRVQNGSDAAGSPGFGRAFVRNLAKIAIPWQLGHQVAIGAASGAFDDGDPATIGATIATYLVMFGLAGSTLLGRGRGLHDRVAGTRVADARP